MTSPQLRYATATGKWVLTATVLGSAMAGIDATAVGIALPAIGREFHSGVTELQWVSNAYTLTLAGLLLLGGALGDRFGRRRLFMIGTVWFAAASFLCGVAPSAELLIAARGLQGVGAALLTPGSLAILEASFTHDDSSKAIGAWSGLGGVATAVGPLLGGWLIAAVSWRAIFFINLPVAVAVLWISSRHVPESRDPASRGRLDYTGAALATAALVGLAYGLTEGAALGWSSPVTVVSLAVGVGCLVAFVLVELHQSNPLLPMELFRSRQFSGANGVTFVVYGGLGGALFLLPVVLQEALGYSALEAGTSLLPLTVVMLALSSRSGALSQRIGPRLQMSVGPLGVAAGLALMTRIGPGSTYIADVLPAVTVLGLGLATTVAPLTSTALSAAPPEHAGVASAVNNDVARTASLFAVAGLPAAAGIHGHTYTDPTLLTSGFHTAVLLAAAACALGGLLAALTIRNPKVAPAHEPCWQCGLDAPAPALSKP
jgi:EmrB/QacA subfamily drug resistance transporter